MFYSNEVTAARMKTFFRLFSLRNLLHLLASSELGGSRPGHDTAESGRDTVIVSMMPMLLTHFSFPSPKRLSLAVSDDTCL